MQTYDKGIFCPKRLEKMDHKMTIWHFLETLSIDIFDFLHKISGP